MNFDVLDFVGCGVHLGDDDVFLVLELLGQLIPDGLQLLAMAAPRSVEFHEDVLSRVFCDRLEVLTDQSLRWGSVPVGGDLVAGEGAEERGEVEEEEKRAELGE